MECRPSSIALLANRWHKYKPTIASFTRGGQLSRLRDDWMDRDEVPLENIPWNVGDFDSVISHPSMSWQSHHEHTRREMQLASLSTRHQSQILLPRDDVNTIIAGRERMLKFNYEVATSLFYAEDIRCFLECHKSKTKLLRRYLDFTTYDHPPFPLQITQDGHWCAYQFPLVWAMRRHENTPRMHRLFGWSERRFDLRDELTKIRKQQRKLRSSNPKKNSQQHTFKPFSARFSRL